MEVTRRLTGQGTLSTSLGGSAVARYFLAVQRRRTAAGGEEVLAIGQVEASLSVLLGADGGRATLTLEDGSAYEVTLRRFTATGAEFRILPPCDALIG